MNIQEAIQKLAQTNERYYSSIAEVLKVNDTTIDVMLVREGYELFDVRIALNKDKGLLVAPVVGSLVIVSYLDKVNAFVSQYSAVDLYTIQNENESLKAILSDLLDAIIVMTHPTPSGPSSPPTNANDFTQIKQRLDKIFKE